MTKDPNQGSLKKENLWHCGNNSSHSFFPVFYLRLHAGLGSIPIFKFQFQSPLKSSIPIPAPIKKFNSNSIPIHLNSIPIQFQFRLQIFINSYWHAISMLLLVLIVTTDTTHYWLITQQLYPSEYDVLASIHTSPSCLLQSCAIDVILLISAVAVDGFLLFICMWMHRLCANPCPTYLQ